MDPDSGPILFGIGIAATGLALKPLRVWGDEWEWHIRCIQRNALRIQSVLRVIGYIPLIGRLSLIGTDLLASSILLAAESTRSKYVSWAEQYLDFLDHNDPCHDRFGMYRQRIAFLEDLGELPGGIVGRVLPGIALVCFVLLLISMIYFAWTNFKRASTRFRGFFGL